MTISEQDEVATANGHPVPAARFAVHDAPPTPHGQAPDADEIGDGFSPAEAVPVDQPAPALPGELPWNAPVERLPLVPVWVMQGAERKAAMAWAVRWCGHAAAFHALRAPKYAARACIYTPRGAARALARYTRWVLDLDAHGLRRELVRRHDADGYHQAARHRDQRVKTRALASLATAAASGIGVLVGALLWAPTVPLVLALAAAGLVWAGRPVGRPFLIDHTVTPPTVTRLTSDVVARALGSLGVAELRKAVEKHELAFTAPIVRDGPGWRAELDLPHGVTAVDVIERRAALSSGLRRPLGCVWPAPAEEEHSGHLVLWVGDRTLAKTPTAPFPLLERGATDMFGPLPFGVDQRGAARTVTLMFASVAVGAQPRMGKTFAVRLLALAAALDPRCELHLFDGKGMGDYVMFEPVAHTFLSGSFDTVLLALRDDLAALKAEVQRRSELLTKLTRAGRCREGKITPELSQDPRLALHPVLVLLDECHLAFDTGSGEAGKLGKEITGLAEFLVRVGPAAGVSLIASTQRPDAVSLPSGIRANVQVRFCLRVADQPTNDMVLGTSAYRTGVRATEFNLADKGIGYLAGEGTEAVVVRTYYVDADQAARIITRARTARETAGTLSGMAAGLAPQRTDNPGELLADILAAMGEEDQIWSSAVCERLAQLRPSRYTGWEAATLGAALKPLRIATAQTWWTPPGGKAGNRNGIRREHIADALKTIRTTNS
jgi:DNA segregation ATPase FtsK/SpoIIIE, S-DNA-T family